MTIAQRTFRWTPASGFDCASFPLAECAQLVLVFASATLRDRWAASLAALAAAYPDAAVVGCSAAGEILDVNVSDEAMVCMAIAFEKTRVRSAVARLGAQGATLADTARQLAAQLAHDELAYVLVLCDGLAVNGSALALALHQALGKQVVISGGLAGDGERFARTEVFHQGQALGGAIVAVGLYGPDLRIGSGSLGGAIVAVGLYGPDLRIGSGSLGGWDPFGPTRNITRATDNVLYELDHQSALALYKRYLGDYAAQLPASGLLFPLAITTDDGGPELVRTLLAVDEATQSMTFAGAIPEGGRAKLMRANFDRLIDGAMGAATQARRLGEAPASVALLISCVGRRMVLGERIEEELEAVREVLGPTPGLIGFYAYGELSPAAPGHCELHNQTMTITTLTEA